MSYLKKEKQYCKGNNQEELIEEIRGHTLSTCLNLCFLNKECYEIALSIYGYC